MITVLGVLAVLLGPALVLGVVCALGPLEDELRAWRKARRPVLVTGFVVREVSPLYYHVRVMEWR